MCIRNCVFLLVVEGFALVKYVDLLRGGVGHGSLVAGFLVGR